jgi:excinuclease ABC subunit A
MEKPDVDEVLGIAPPVAIRQKNTTRNPRSTVATATEIYDYLRLLFARVGVTTCYQCGQVVVRDHVDEVADQVIAMEAGRRFYVLFQVNSGASPAVAERQENTSGTDSPSSLEAKASGRAARARGAGRAHGGSLEEREATPAVRLPAPPDESLKPRLFELRQHGFNRLYQEGRVFEFSTPESLLEVDFAQPVYILVDRLAVGPEIRQRLIDSLELCFREAGEAALEFVSPDPASPPERLVYSERFECKRCKIVFQPPEPGLFSFNNPYGACPRCQGFGNTIDFDLDLVIPDKNKSLA